MAERITLKPCGRCEQELPPACYASDEEMFCKKCSQEIAEIIGKKYNTIEAAVVRAKLRRQTRRSLTMKEARTGM